MQIFTDGIHSQGSVISRGWTEHRTALDIKDSPNNKNSNLAHGKVYNSPILTAGLNYRDK